MGKRNSSRKGHKRDRGRSVSSDRRSHRRSKHKRRDSPCSRSPSLEDRHFRDLSSTEDRRGHIAGDSTECHIATKGSSTESVPIVARSTEQHAIVDTMPDQNKQIPEAGQVCIDEPAMDDDNNSALSRIAGLPEDTEEEAISGIDGYPEMDRSASQAIIAGREESVLDYHNHSIFAESNADANDGSCVKDMLVAAAKHPLSAYDSRLLELTEDVAKVFDRAFRFSLST